MDPRTRLEPPRPEPRPVVRQAHGVSRVDDYAWLAEAGDPEVFAHLEAERAYYEASVAHLASLKGELAAEQRRRTPTTQTGARWQRGPFVYYTQSTHGEEFERHLGVDLRTGREISLLDPRQIAPNATHFDIGAFEPSPGGAVLAYALDTAGDEVYTLRFKVVASGLDLPDVIERSYFGGAWSADASTYFYLVHDDAFRPHRLMRHRLGEDPGLDVEVLREDDQAFELTVHGSRCGKWVVATAANRDTSEVHLISAVEPLETPRLVARRRRGITYTVEPLPGGWYGNGDDRLLIVTDDVEPEFRLVLAPVPGQTEAPSAHKDPSSVSEETEPPDWRAVARATRGGERLVEVAAFDAHIVLTLHANAEPYLRVLDRARKPDEQGALSREIHSGLPCGQLALWHADTADRAVVTIEEQNLITAARWVEVELATGARKVVHRTEVPGVDPTAYVTERLMAEAPDGTRVPVTIARRRDLEAGKGIGALLYGYGAYEVPWWPEFEVGTLSLLDRGVVFALAHPRGGGEMGRRWWLDGRLGAKQHTFTDFIAAREALAKAGWAGPDRVVCRGLSAGGLLQGVVFSQAPDRWRAVIAEVPFVDVVTSMSDPSIPLTINEWDEWGDPIRDPEAFAWMLAYSPYDNPPPSGIRPPLLATGALHDPRVMVHEPAKWVARLRATDDQDHPSEVLFRVEVGAGAHTGPQGRWSRLDYEAEILAWALWHLREDPA